MSQSIKLIDWRNPDKWPKLYNTLFKVVEIYKPYAQKNKKFEKQAWNNVYNDLWKQDAFKEYEECCVQLEAIKTQYKKCLTDFEKWQLKGNRSGHEGDLDELAKAIKKSLDGKEKKNANGILKKEDLKDLDACADYALTVATAEKTKASMQSFDRASGQLIITPCSNKTASTLSSSSEHQQLMDYLNSPERKRKEKLNGEAGSLMLNSFKNLSILQLLTESEISKMKVMRDTDTAQTLIEDLEDIGIVSLIRTFLNGKDMLAIITAFQNLSPQMINARIANKLYSFFVNSFEKFEETAALKESDLSKVREPNPKKAKVMPSVGASRNLNESDAMSTSDDDDDDDQDDDVDKEDDVIINNIGKDD